MSMKLLLVVRFREASPPEFQTEKNSDRVAVTNWELSMVNNQGEDYLVGLEY